MVLCLILLPEKGPLLALAVVNSLPFSSVQGLAKPVHTHNKCSVGFGKHVLPFVCLSDLKPGLSRVKGVASRSSVLGASVRLWAQEGHVEVHFWIRGKGQPPQQRWTPLHSSSLSPMF